jgi:hypothetical protein
MKQYPDPQLKYSERHFSLNRLAYCLDAITFSLLLLYFYADPIFGRQMICGIGWLLTVVVLILCLLTQRSVRYRWFPCLIGFSIMLVHGLFNNHL